MTATEALGLLALPVYAVAVAALARRIGLSAPPALVLAGLAASFLPVVPDVRLDPEVALFVFLPPLLFVAAWESSYHNLREHVRPIGLLSVGLVLFTTFVLGYAAYLVVPGLGLAPAFVLAALLAPPDAVAAVGIARRLGLPRRVVTILVGESLFNDATALTLFRVALTAAVGAGFSVFDGAGRFLFAALIGTAVGLALGPLLHWLRGRLNDPLVETVVPILAPFAGYLTAEALHASGVIAVVVTGLYLGHRSTESPAPTRLLSRSFWTVVVFVLESVVFLLIGLQLPVILDMLLSTRNATTLAWNAVVIFLVVSLARFAWVLPSAYIPLWLSRRIRQHESGVDWRHRIVVSWAGMRGVVSLAAAFAIPLKTDSGVMFPGRDLVLFFTFTTVLASLLLQGLTFPGLVRLLGLGAEAEQHADAVAEAGAQHEAAKAALGRLEELTRDESGPFAKEAVDRLRQLAEDRQFRAWERLGGGTGPAGEEVPTAVYRRLRREMLTAEREVFVRLRDQRRIDDEVLQRILHELDLEEVMLSRD
ncbi:MAG: Na+/H+ antiporter [Streptosporangiaceae bacterium]|nr:Na+/H+ antiporter [Streptosporangiaceae bacterium]